MLHLGLSQVNWRHGAVAVGLTLPGLTQAIYLLFEPVEFREDVLFEVVCLYLDADEIAG